MFSGLNFGGHDAQLSLLVGRVLCIALAAAALPLLLDLAAFFCARGTVRRAAVGRPRGLSGDHVHWLTVCRQTEPDRV